MAPHLNCHLNLLVVFPKILQDGIVLRSGDFGEKQSIIKKFVVVLENFGNVGYFEVKVPIVNGRKNRKVLQKLKRRFFTENFECDL